MFLLTEKASCHRNSFVLDFADTIQNCSLILTQNAPRNKGKGEGEGFQLILEGMINNNTTTQWQNLKIIFINPPFSNCISFLACSRHSDSGEQG